MSMRRLTKVVRPQGLSPPSVGAVDDTPLVPDYVTVFRLCTVFDSGCTSQVNGGSSNRWEWSCGWSYPVQGAGLLK